MVSKNIIKIIDRLVSNARGFQMIKEEYEYVCSFLGGKNLLVFGTGNDSFLWCFANEKGKTFFLENGKKWIDDAKNKIEKFKNAKVFDIKYTCKMKNYLNLLEKYKNGDCRDLYVDLPKEILNEQWDCIYVDSPLGFNFRRHHGRIQSIYMAKFLCGQRTDVFIHDYHRKVEKQFVDELFNHKLKQIHKLIHVKN